MADVFRKNFEERDDLGAACSVVSDGAVVVDLWGGHRDKAQTLPWQQDTLVTVFSCTKGMAAAAMAVAHSRGWFELDDPVSSYWPEFAANGKENVTVRQLLAHQAGLAVIDTKIKYEHVANFKQLGAILAEQKPGWEPGTSRGYHAQTVGWYISQLISRLDPDGRQIGQFFPKRLWRRSRSSSTSGCPHRSVQIGLPKQWLRLGLAKSETGTRFPSH